MAQKLKPGDVIVVTGLNGGTLSRPHYAIVVDDRTLSGTSYYVSAWVFNPGKEFHKHRKEYPNNVNYAGKGWYFTKGQFEQVPADKVPDEVWAEYVAYRLTNADAA